MLKINRQCKECSECCKGWLTANIYGKEMTAGRPCHYYSGSECSIYKDRPEDPCVQYLCHWLENQDIPEWMKPSLSKVIITNRKWSGGTFLHIKECGQKMDSTVLNWIYMYVSEKNINMAIEVGGALYFKGPEGFSQEATRLFNEIIN